MRFCFIHLREISCEGFRIWICKMSWKIALLKSHHMFQGPMSWNTLLTSQIWEILLWKLFCVVLLTHWPQGNVTDSWCAVFKHTFLWLMSCTFPVKLKRCMHQNLVCDKSTLVQMMAWCRQAASHHLNQMSTNLCLWHFMTPPGHNKLMINREWLKFYRLTPSHYLNTLRSRQIDAISQTTLWNAFSWMKMFEFRLKCHWSLFPRVQLTIFQHWFK